jgi:acyl carrier protein
MLSEGGQPSRADIAAVESRVREIVSETIGVASAGAPLRDAPLDSLTLMAIVTRIEVAFEVAFEGDEIVALLGTNDFAALARLTAAKVGERLANLDEPPGNESC